MQGGIYIYIHITGFFYVLWGNSSQPARQPARQPATILVSLASRLIRCLTSCLDGWWSDAAWVGSEGERKRQRQSVRERYRERERRIEGEKGRER